MRGASPGGWTLDFDEMPQLYEPLKGGSPQVKGKKGIISFFSFENKMFYVASLVFLFILKLRFPKNKSIADIYI